jgi:peptidoglycan/LPS O-acetylase OafA/YrhL
VAVVGVVLYHAGHLRGGFLGVDLFFVLSGFLITGVLLRSHREHGSIDLKRFWTRRARRLLPALLVVVGVVVPVYSAWFATPVEQTLVRRDALSSLVYLTNWQQIWNGQSYWAATLGASPLRHAWSLAVEEQFYVVWPLVVVLLLRRYRPKALPNALTAAAIGAGLLTIVLAVTRTESLNSLYLGTHSRSAALLAGAALAARRSMEGRRPTGPRPTLEMLAVVAAAIYAWMWMTAEVSSRLLYTGGLALSAVCAVTLVAAAANPRPGPVVQVLLARPLQYLGTISYGVYLWSWPIMQMISVRHTPLRGYELLAVQLAATLAAATLSWHLLERPVLRGELWSPQTVRSVVATVAVVAVVVVVTTLGAKPLLPTTASTGGYAKATTPGAPRIMVVGDSVPNRIVEEGVAPLRNELGVSVVDRTVPGCVLLRERGAVKGLEGNIRNDVTPCNRNWRADAQALKPNIALMLFGQFASDQVDLDGTFALPCTPAYQAAERKSLEAGIDDLTASGAHVVLATAPGTSVSWVLDAAPPGLDRRMTCLNDLYTQIASERPDTDVVDFAKLACPRSDQCLDNLNGVNLRDDTIHFRGDAAKLVARWLIPRTVAAAKISDRGP